MANRIIRIGMVAALWIGTWCCGGCVARREPVVIIAPSYSHVQAAAGGSVAHGMALTAAPTLEGARY
jgi:hypothetical protein